MTDTTQVEALESSSAPVSPAPSQAFTTAGARKMDRAAADAVRAQGRTQAREAEEMARLRIQQAQQEAERKARAEEEQRRAARRAQKQKEKDERRARLAQAWQERRPLAVVLPMMALSAAVALPAQYASYFAATGQLWTAVTIAMLVEGGTWLGAVLESAAAKKKKPTGLYRAITWGLAGLASAVNFVHGMAKGPDMAIGLSLASLMGAGAWAAYMHQQSAENDERSIEERRLTLLRRLRYPVLSYRAFSLRTATGPSLNAAQAWALVWTTRSATRQAGRFWFRGKGPEAPARPVASMDQVVDSAFSPLLNSIVVNGLSLPTAPLGVSAGSTDQVPAGGARGRTASPTGSVRGSSGGSTMGPISGPSGSTAGSPTSAHPGSLNGSSAGSPSGSRIGSSAGSANGSSTGSTAGSRSGSTAGSTGGSASGSTAGSLGGSRGMSAAGSSGGSEEQVAAGSSSPSPLDGSQRTVQELRARTMEQLTQELKQAFKDGRLTKESTPRAIRTLLRVSPDRSNELHKELQALPPLDSQSGNNS